MARLGDCETAPFFICNSWLEEVQPAALCCSPLFAHRVNAPPSQHSVRPTGGEAGDAGGSGGYRLIWSLTRCLDQDYRSCLFYLIYFKKDEDKKLYITSLDRHGMYTGLG